MELLFHQHPRWPCIPELLCACEARLHPLVKTTACTSNFCSTHYVKEENHCSQPGWVLLQLPGLSQLSLKTNGQSSSQPCWMSHLWKLQIFTAFQNKVIIHYTSYLQLITSTPTSLKILRMQCINFKLTYNNNFFRSPPSSAERLSHLLKQQNLILECWFKSRHSLLKHLSRW